MIQLQSSPVTFWGLKLFKIMAQGSGYTYTHGVMYEAMGIKGHN